MMKTLMHKKFANNRNELIFEKEYNVREPLQIIRADVG